MLLANISVGEINIKNDYNKTLLRRHPFPKPTKVQKFQNFLKMIGY